VEVREQSWGIAYRGDKEALLAAGVLREEWMPRVPPGKKKTVGRTTLPDGREVHVSRVHSARKAGRELPLDVWHKFTDEEVAQRQPRFDAARKAEEVHERAEREIAAWPTSKADFARRIERNCCSILRTVHDFVKAGMGGYRVADESMEEITDAFAELVEAMRTAEITFDPAERQRAEAKLRGKAASHDPAFGAFLDRALTPPAEGEPAA
jgi:hypothetical protein